MHVAHVPPITVPQEAAGADTGAGALQPLTDSIQEHSPPVYVLESAADITSNGSDSSDSVMIDVGSVDAVMVYKNLVSTGMDPEEIPKGIACAKCKHWNQITANTGYKWWAVVRGRRVGVFYEHQYVDLLSPASPSHLTFQSVVVKDWVEGHSNSSRKSFKTREKAVEHFEDALFRGQVQDIHGKVKDMNGNTPIYFTTQELLDAAHTVPPSAPAASGLDV